MTTDATSNALARHVLEFLSAARKRRQAVTVPAAVLVEWWRGQRGPAARSVRCRASLDEKLAYVAGAALARVATGPSATDAVVVASAARGGDVVLTSDVDDLSRRQAVFPAVRILGI